MRPTPCTSFFLNANTKNVAQYLKDKLDKLEGELQSERQQRKKVRQWFGLKSSRPTCRCVR